MKLTFFFNIKSWRFSFRERVAVYRRSGTSDRDYVCQLFLSSPSQRNSLLHSMDESSPCAPSASMLRDPLSHFLRPPVAPLSDKQSLQREGLI
jgi:hypothetical protein